MDYRIPLNTSISRETMVRLDKIKKAGGKLSRGEVIDKAVALLERTEKEGGAK